MIYGYRCDFILDKRRHWVAFPGYEVPRDGKMRLDSLLFIQPSSIVKMHYSAYRNRKGIGMELGSCFYTMVYISIIVVK